MVDQGLNPLVAAANRLLLLVPQLRETRHVADPDSLRASLAQGSAISPRPCKSVASRPSA
jgi:type VI protein secretion system component VasF